MDRNGMHEGVNGQVAFQQL
ncbi:uncharacterized protein G2W53_012485 [Senna tora]|uniref:Uncharacterized protein n=1 Tax=Senna tora TaxID=362788 RepID=A0A834WPT0_9FABA|nr:uncharacterized protein G2W53_012485 [Senna tora]